MVLDSREDCVWAQVRPIDVESFAQAVHSPSAQWHADEGVTTSWAAYNNVSDEVVLLRADQGVSVPLRCALLMALYCRPFGVSAANMRVKQSPLWLLRFVTADLFQILATRLFWRKLLAHGTASRLSLVVRGVWQAAGGHSAVVTFAPVLEAEGLAFAAIGLTDMLNSGGAVLGCSLRRGTVPVEPTPIQPRSGRNGSKPKASRGMTGRASLWGAPWNAGSDVDCLPHRGRKFHVQD